jgi:hypothetical protein
MAVAVAEPPLAFEPAPEVPLFKGLADVYADEDGGAAQRVLRLRSTASAAAADAGKRSHNTRLHQLPA